MANRIVLLAPNMFSETLRDIVREIAPDMEVTAVETIAAVSPPLSENDVLIAYGTGEVVQAAVLDRVQTAINLHAASPDYPGRDPHHFAVYDGATRYGATAHLMAESVDSGPILDVELFDVPPGASPSDLLSLSNNAALELFRRTIPVLIRGEKLLPLADTKWGKRKTTRKQFRDLCRIPAAIDRDEFERRVAAVKVPGRNNLILELHGKSFRLCEEEPVFGRIGEGWSDFTEDAYARLLDLIRANYDFAGFSDSGEGRRVLMRHDIELSVHRAARLAAIEKDKGVRATYFFMLQSAFYSWADPSVRRCAQSIIAAGHWIGLHFDTTIYPLEPMSAARRDGLIRMEREQLERILGVQIEAVSFSGLDRFAVKQFDVAEISGLLNADAIPFRGSYGYCADTEGSWRSEPISDVVLSGRHEQLQIVIDPGWWTPTPMPPRQRVERCILGRAAANLATCDARLEAAGLRDADRREKDS